ncbi:c-type cytochrome [Cohnella terricola]|nr:cytochrome c [Cohnella terricola]
MTKRMMAFLVCLACVFAVYLLSTGLPHKEETTSKGAKFTVPDRPVDTAESERIYQSMCIACHGDQLQGAVGPELAHIGGTMTKEQLFKKISSGGGGMPAFQSRLTEDELVTIVTWLASHQ